MTYLLDDVLLIGKAEAGKIHTNYASIPIKQFFTQLAKEVEQNATTHKIIVRMSCTVDSFSADEKLLRNILINLLTNAIKFSTFVKSVFLTVTSSNDSLYFDVEDKGIGIQEDDLKDIFAAFHRGGNVGSIQGTGLGLSIAKKAVELMQGDISVESRLGKGTIFKVRLPLQV
jgi:signal transduction histidine kinase